MQMSDINIGGKVIIHHSGRPRPGTGIRAYICTPTLGLIPRSIRTMSIRVQLERMIDLQQFFPDDRVMCFESLANETDRTL